ncbi:MAG: sigma-70 family RNA polymerase sigma factor [Chitinophagaceae bacterium]
MNSLKPLLTTYAYNIIGSLEDAKDIVQDAFLKFEFINKEKVKDQKSYLIRTVINLSINFKKKFKKHRVEYPGEWLPEPVDMVYADSALEKKEILSYSLMVLLEKLNAKQRAVFILKEAFDYEHEKIADVLNINVDNSRQILNRAKKQLQQDVSNSNKKVGMDQLTKFLDIIQNGDTERLEGMLYEDVTLVSDGGGKAVAFINPIIGRKSVLALLVGVNKKFYADFRVEKAWVNHQPALLYYDNDALVTCQVMIFKNDQLENIFTMRNPDKLKTLEKKS